MKNKNTKQFVDSIFDERIWQMDEEYQKEMVRLWIALAYEEGRKSLKLEVHKKINTNPSLKDTKYFSIPAITPIEFEEQVRNVSSRL